MEPEDSLPQSQVPARCPCPEPARSSPYPHTLQSHLNIILPSMLGSRVCLLESKNSSNLETELNVSGSEIEDFCMIAEAEFRNSGLTAEGIG